MPGCLPRAVPSRRCCPVSAVLLPRPGWVSLHSLHNKRRIAQPRLRLLPPIGSPGQRGARQQLPRRPSGTRPSLGAGTGTRGAGRVPVQGRFRTRVSRPRSLPAVSAPHAADAEGRAKPPTPPAACQSRPLKFARRRGGGGLSPGLMGAEMGGCSEPARAWEASGGDSVLGRLRPGGCNAGHFHRSESGRRWRAAISRLSLEFHPERLSWAHAHTHAHRGAGTGEKCQGCFCEPPPDAHPPTPAHHDEKSQQALGRRQPAQVSLDL